MASTNSAPCQAEPGVRFRPVTVYSITSPGRGGRVVRSAAARAANGATPAASDATGNAASEKAATEAPAASASAVRLRWVRRICTWGLMEGSGVTFTVRMYLMPV